MAPWTVFKAVTLLPLKPNITGTTKICTVTKEMIQLLYIQTTQQKHPC